MQPDPVAEELKDIVKALKILGNSVSQLAAIARLPLIYAPAQSLELIAQYRELNAINERAFQALNSTADEKMTHEQRVNMYGETEAKKHQDHMHSLINAKQQAGKALGDFEQLHPLIKEIVTGHPASSDD